LSLPFKLKFFLIFSRKKRIRNVARCAAWKSCKVLVDWVAAFG
jgi:hypothetical protein